MGASTDTGFEPPRFDAPIDVAAYIRQCPADIETRGTFFQFVASFVEQRLGTVPAPLFEGISRRQWIAWKHFPVVDFMRLAVNAAGLVFPGQPVRESLRQIGWMAYPSFASTMAGRVVIYAFGEDLDALMMAVPRAYGLTLTRAAVDAKHLGPRHWRVEMRDVYNFADTYHVGVLEGAVRARGHAPRLTVRRHPRACDLDIDVGW